MRKKSSILLIIILMCLPLITYAGKWECISMTIAGCNTWRWKVPTGWMVASDNYTGEHAYAMTFVPDPNHEWEN